MGRLNEIILDQDVYARPVNLNFRGRDRFATTRGGLLSIMVYITGAWLGLALLERFYSQVDPIISVYDKDFDEED
jgi:predicted small integral membrane protein